jgi:hypothetical protein
VLSYSERSTVSKEQQIVRTLRGTADVLYELADGLSNGEQFKGAGANDLAKSLALLALLLWQLAQEPTPELRVVS